MPAGDVRVEVEWVSPAYTAAPAKQARVLKLMYTPPGGTAKPITLVPTKMA